MSFVQRPMSKVQRSQTYRYLLPRRFDWRRYFMRPEINWLTSLAALERVSNCAVEM